MQVDHCFIFFLLLQSIKTLQKQAEGLCQVLNMKPSQASLEIHREVFAFKQPPPATPATSRNRLPIKRALEEAAAREGYVPNAKTLGCSVGEDEKEWRRSAEPDLTGWKADVFCLDINSSSSSQNQEQKELPVHLAPRNHSRTPPEEVLALKSSQVCCNSTKPTFHWSVGQK